MFPEHAECQTFPHPDLQSAQWELNPHFRHGKAAGYRYIMGAKLHHYQIVKDQNQEHRAGIEPALPRYDGGVLPLDHQCLYFSGTGENRTHIVRFKRPMHYLVCHNPMCRLFRVDRRGRN